MRSIARHGHKMVLYCYREFVGVPEEVEVRDASQILPYETITAPWCNRPDLYSDWFRYELLRRGLGTWVDTDVYLLAPLDVQARTSSALKRLIIIIRPCSGRRRTAR